MKSVLPKISGGETLKNDGYVRRASTRPVRASTT
jgi:hypothetical protein